jgi:D-mannonate dehydratase
MRGRKIAAAEGFWVLRRTWMRAGRTWQDVFEMIDFGGGKIADVHFRVSPPLPKFVETFTDDGYVNMYEDEGLRKVKFNGTVVPDHAGLAGTAVSLAGRRIALRI